MGLNYNIIEHKSIIIIYYYKVGSRFLDAYFSKYNVIKSVDFKQHFVCLFHDNQRGDTIKVGNYYIESDMILSNPIIEKILKNELVDTPILLLYRSPYEKTLSGLCEDFHEEFMRGEDSVRYIDMESFYKYIDDGTHSKIKLNFLNKICNGLNTMDTLTLIENDSELKESYISLLKKYAEYRIIMNQIGIEGHTEFHTHKTFTILNELNKEQKYELVNLDDTNVSLQNILDTYNLNQVEYINKNEFSNSGYKTMLDTMLDLKTKEDLYKILESEMNFYNILNTHS